MANEQNIPKHEPPKQDAAKGPLRIPVTKVWLREQMDFPRHSVAQNIICVPQTSLGRPFVVGHWVPAWGGIELEFWRDEQSEPYRTRVTLAAVNRFD